RVLAAGHVRMSELIDKTDGGSPREDGTQVHLAQSHSPILRDLRWYDLKIDKLILGLGAAVSFNKADDDVHALFLQALAFAKHGIGLADARRRSQIDLEPPAGLTTNQVEELLRRRSCRLGDGHGRCSISGPVRSARRRYWSRVGSGLRDSG